jgi:lipoyl(octanoyl) transferase
VSNQRRYHGVALNVAMDLEPYARIDPCGYARLRTVDLQRLGVAAGWTEVAETLASRLQARLC